MKVGTIMTRTLVTASLDDDVAHLREFFQRLRFHHLPVVDDGKLVGVISDRDLLRYLSPFVDTLAERPLDAKTLHTKAHQLMTRKPIVAHPETDLREAARTLIDKRISCLPVVDGEGVLQGILTWRDLLSALLASTG
jgi:acetoin utilization protein AcuB